jgi:RNA polymerase sigma factor (TIGR02999 family)
MPRVQQRNQPREYQPQDGKIWFVWSCPQLPHVYSEGLSEFTHILERVGQGDPKAAGELLPLVYDELRRVAAQKMTHEAAGHTLQPTALVHEAWLRLGGEDAPSFQNRAHFFGAAAEAMRRILIEHARRRLAAKRGAGVEPVDLDGLEISSPAADDDQLLAVNDALEKLAMLDDRKAELVKLRYFVGMNFEEAAAALGIAVPTAKQWWAYARAWLTVEMRGSPPC